uniref:Uncharacterized protein n=1 Tax=Arundo donax TaxID=35708 RepID=A0A0A9GVM9_ARUDO
MFPDALGGEDGQGVEPSALLLSRPSRRTSPPLLERMMTAHRGNMS